MEQQLNAADQVEMVVHEILNMVDEVEIAAPNKSK